MNEKKKNITIYDIAKKARTSTATVSRVLSNSGYPVSNEMQKRIQQVAAELKYSPNLVGRMLKKSVNQEIGVIIPNISNPFYPQLILGIETEARKYGFSIMLCNTFRSVEDEKKYIEIMYQKQIKGIILSSIGEQHSFLKEYIDKGLKIVGFDQNFDDFQVSRVSFDFTKGAIMAMDYLVSMGHKKIAFASSPLSRRSRKEIFKGYNKGLLKNGLVLSQNYVYLSENECEIENGIYEFNNGVQIAAKIRKSKDLPTVVFAVNDITAIGIMRGLAEEGLKIPEDISVVGYDNIEFSSMVTPPLTTINQPSFETGKLACRFLIESINQEENDIISLALEPSLIVRKSVRRLDK